MARKKQEATVKYSEALKEVQKILQDIENESIDIDDLTASVKRAVDLIQLCKHKIEKTELEIKSVVESFSMPKEEVQGAPGTDDIPEAQPDTTYDDSGEDGDDIDLLF